MQSDPSYTYSNDHKRNKRKRVIVISDDECEYTHHISGNPHRTIERSHSSRTIPAERSHSSYISDTIPSNKKHKENNSHEDRNDFKSHILELMDCIRHNRSSRDLETLEALQNSVSSRSLKVFGTPNFHSIDANHIEKVYRIIDDTLMFGVLSKLMKLEKRKVLFRASSRMTSRAGQVVTDSRCPLVHELGVSSHLLFKAFSPVSFNRSITVNGIVCRSRLDCLLSIVQHEMIHLLFCCNYVRDNLPEGFQREPYHGPTFQRAVRNLFGQTDWTHDLPTTDEQAYVEKSIVVGAIVAFEFEGERFKGRVNRVQKRVTVLVEDKSKSNPHPAAREFSDGKFYRKFYIPVDHCSVVE